MLHDIKDLTLEGKKDPTSMQQRLKNLETKFESENEDKLFSLEKSYKTGKITGKGGDLCGFNIRPN